jgi:predicted nucleotidyltransferase
MPSSILFGYRGSQAHGTWRPPTDPTSIDDVDLMGVTIGPIEQYLGFPKQETWERMEDDASTKLMWDIVVYDVRHFVRLLCKCNPNVLGMLYLEPNYYTKLTPAGKLLIENRDVFSSKEAYRSFTGYAYSQLHKMTHGAHKGYMGDKRKKLVDQFGYDTKNASHLIRIQKMGIEFMMTGKLNVMREDNTYLVDIKQGKYPLEYIQKEAARLFELSETALVNSKLPDKVDLVAAEKLLVRILSEHFNMKTDSRVEALASLATGRVAI